MKVYNTSNFWEWLIYKIAKFYEDNTQKLEMITEVCVVKKKDKCDVQLNDEAWLIFIHLLWNSKMKEAVDLRIVYCLRWFNLLGGIICGENIRVFIQSNQTTPRWLV